MIEFLHHEFFLESFHWVIEHFVPRHFKLKIHHEMLTWAQLLFRIRIINFVGDVIRINICCLGRKTMLGVFMLT